MVSVKIKSRSYFVGKGKANRAIVWDSPQRRGNRREVVKKRRDGPRAWFENEGFGYEIVDIGGLWCVRIKPFYMFNGRDAHTRSEEHTSELQSLMRTSYAVFCLKKKNE